MLVKLVIGENHCNFIVFITKKANNNRYVHRGQSYEIILYGRWFPRFFDELIAEYP